MKDRVRKLGQSLEPYGRQEATKSTGELQSVFDSPSIEMTLSATPEDHPDRAMYLNNLENRLDSRYERTGSMDVLNRAVEVADMAVNATPQDHSDRAGRLNSLGNWLGSRFERMKSIDDRNRALLVYQECWDCSTSPPSARITSARRAATILAPQHKWKEASSLLEGAVKLIPLVSPRALANNHRCQQASQSIAQNQSLTQQRNS
jgi:hypothetical protein